jgi:hypothetical protein
MNMYAWRIARSPCLVGNRSAADRRRRAQPDFLTHPGTPDSGNNIYIPVLLVAAAALGALVPSRAWSAGALLGLPGLVLPPR